MNQQCKVCGEPAAGFHFGAFTCEGCKSFFGRSYNNLSAISECKNNGGCVINKKNRTSCKACRLRKCLMVGMSKSGSRYGRRSNWFKIHCLLQEQQQQSQQHQQKQHKNNNNNNNNNSTWDPHPGVGMMNHPDPRIHQFLSQQHAMGRPTTREDLVFMGLDEYKNSTSPSISSPESHNSDSSVEVSDARLRANFFWPPESKDNVFLPFANLPVFPPPFSFPPMFPPNYLYKPTSMITTSTTTPNNNNNGEPVDVYSKRFFLDAVLQSQRSPNVKEEDDDTETEEEHPCDQENPMDLSMKNCLIQERTSHSDESDDMTDIDDVTVDNEEEDDDDSVGVRREEMPEVRSAPMDLSVSLKC